MTVTNASEVPIDRLGAIAESASRLETLEDLLAWGRSDSSVFTSPATITDVVVQDECTHDVVVNLASGLVLVFDST